MSICLIDKFSHQLNLNVKYIEIEFTKKITIQMNNDGEKLCKLILFILFLLITLN